MVRLLGKTMLGCSFQQREVDCSDDSGFSRAASLPRKKEWVGNFKNAGRCWRQEDRDVLDHDYPSWALGRAIPVGVYDVARNDGFVLAGTSHDTPAFTVAAIRRWWLEVGRWRYPKARRFLIPVAGGGATDHRKWGWKVALQGLADEFGLGIAVTHYPGGTSKWNLIEHRLFGPISKNWEGEPLASYELIVKDIRRTRTETGLRCRARRDSKEHPVEHGMPAQAMARVRLERRRLRPELNYTIYPHGPGESPKYLLDSRLAHAPLRGRPLSRKGPTLCCAA